MILGYRDLEEGEIRQRVRQPGLAMIVAEGFLAPHLKLKVALGITRNQDEAGMGDGMAVPAVENADGDGVVVNHREGFIRCAR
jgi:hypothetical protein